MALVIAETETITAEILLNQYIVFCKETRPSGEMKQFYLRRNEDVSGNTGIGIVAEGVILSSGKAVMQWLDPLTSVVIFDSIEHLEAIHGHTGKTVVMTVEALIIERGPS